MKVIRTGRKCELHIHSDRFSVYSGGARLFTFFCESKINLPGKADEDSDISLESYDETMYIWEAKSSLWEKKEYVLEGIKNGFVFYARVRGCGRPENIEYFRGSSACSGSRFNVAGYTALDCQQADMRSRFCRIDSVPAEIIPLRACPPPYVFPFYNDFNDEFCGLGICAPAGENNYRRLTLNAPETGWKENGMWLTLDLDGYTEINGVFTSPRVWFGFGDTDFDVVSNWSDYQYYTYGFKRNIDEDDTPGWWRGPVFCGWGAQCDLAEKEGTGDSKYYARQNIYADFAEKLKKENINPSIVIVDDKWQKNYGTLEPDPEKWPDLRGFADSLHNDGRHLLLWLKCWCPEGLPDDECIFADGRPYCCDPTNPKYLARLKNAIHTLLSADEGCFNCDGFKIDFMDNYPWNGGAEIFEKGVSGLELMKRLFHAIYTFAKEEKPDALINMSSAHPYFAEDCDMFRIHDYNANLRSWRSAMEYRARLARAVLPGVLVDMDGFRGNDRFTTLHALRCNAQTGIPDLYYFPDELSPGDMDEIKELFSR